MICVECGHVIKHTYRLISKGNIRLTRCNHCELLADKYVEFDMVIIAIDLVLHKPQVYRHLIFNRMKPYEWGVAPGVLWLGVLVLFFDSYVKWADASGGFESLNVAENLLCAECGCGWQWLYQAAIELAGFLAGVVLGVSIQPALNGGALNYLVMSIVLSSFGKLFHGLAMIWDYSEQRQSFGTCIEAFVLASNVVALRVYLESTVGNVLLVVLVGYMSKRVAGVFGASLLMC